MGCRVDRSRLVQGIMKEELTKILANPSDEVELEPRGDEDMLNWVGTIRGPKESPYEGGVFYLDISVPHSYPYSQPEIIFSTPIYHPYVNNSGVLSSEFIKSNWNNKSNLADILSAVYSLLAQPIPEELLVNEIAGVCLKDRELFTKTCREWTIQHAM